MISIDKLNEVGDRVFFSPSPLLTYEKLVKCSLGSNTYRGFHRIDKCGLGASSVFKKILIEKRNFIINEIKEAKSEIELDSILKHLCNELLQGLKVNIRHKQLNSFNKIRKPMDIVIQHMVSMGEDFNCVRSIVTNWLCLPLDSQMFQSNFIFTDQEVKSLHIKRHFTFKDIEEEIHYIDIQQFLKEKSIQIGLKHRIYFDLVWNDRYKSSGTNLLLTNPR